MSMENRGSFIRWQAITLNQLTYAVNLILTLSVGVLGFSMSLLRDEQFKPTVHSRCLFILATCLISFSIGFGIFCVINRLRDFRVTTKVARMRDVDRATDDQRAPYVLLYKTLGRRTWWLFCTQIVLFGLAVLLYMLCMVATFYQKLF